MIVTRSATASRSMMPAAARAVHADGVDFIAVGQGIELVGQVADRRNGRNVAVHRIDALEGDELGRIRIGGSEQFAQMIQVVVAEDELLAARIADTRDHGGVIELVGEDQAARQDLAERRERGLVRHIARGEEQCALLAVQIGQLGLEVDMVVRVTADIASAARTGADIVQRLFHRRDHLGMLAHGEIIVGAPDRDRPGAVVAGEAAGVGILTPVAQDIDEHPIAALFMEPLDRLVEDVLVVHHPAKPSFITALQRIGAGRSPETKVVFVPYCDSLTGS